MKQIPLSALFTALLIAPAPLLAAPNSVWNAATSPALPLRYIESAPVLRLTPQIANRDTYAPESLFLHLYPSISTQVSTPVETIEASITSKTTNFGPIRPRGILSSSYVQEFAYIDTYSNTRKFEETFSFPSIRMSLAMPRFGNGLGGGYQPLQIGFGPAAFKFW